MNTSQEFSKQAEFALAAYANLQPGIPATAALEDRGNGMSSTQAQLFASTYTVVVQYNGAPRKTSLPTLGKISLS